MAHFPSSATVLSLDQSRSIEQRAPKRLAFVRFHGIINSGGRFGGFHGCSIDRLGSIWVCICCLQVVPIGLGEEPSLLHPALLSSFCLRAGGKPHASSMGKLVQSALGLIVVVRRPAGWPVDCKWPSVVVGWMVMSLNPLVAVDEIVEAPPSHHTLSCFALTPQMPTCSCSRRRPCSLLCDSSTRTADTLIQPTPTQPQQPGQPGKGAAHLAEQQQHLLVVVVRPSLTPARCVSWSLDVGVGMLDPCIQKLTRMGSVHAVARVDR